MPRRVIVVPTAQIPDALVRDAVAAHAGRDAVIHVVAPASKISPLDWLTNDEAAARGEAEERAEAVAEAAPNAHAVAHVGDSDPVQAIEDALRMFPADEVVVITAPDESANWLESGAGEKAKERFAVPVTHLTVGPSQRS
jgi:hypothetical protein